MVVTHPINPANDRMLKFLKNEIGLTDSEIKLGMKQAELQNSPLPIVLWSYGIISLSQLDFIMNWQFLSK